jgi:hypothetical protein
MRFERRADLVLDHLLARPVAARVELDGERGLARLGRAEVGERVAARAAAGHRGVDALHVRDLHHAAPRFLGRGRGLRERGARRQRQVHLRLRVVVRRNEAGLQQRDHRQRTEEEEGGHAPSS